MLEAVEVDGACALAPAALGAFSIVEDESQFSHQAHMQQQLFAVASFSR